MVTIIRHVFINIFQTEHFLAVKLSMGYEKNISLLVAAKFPKVLLKVETIGLGFFKILQQQKLVLLMDSGKIVYPSLLRGKGNYF